MKGLNKEPKCFMTKIFRFIKIFRNILKVNFAIYIKYYKYKFLLKLIRNLLLSYSDNSKNIGQQLKNTLEELGPIFVKFGQLLSTRHDMFPQKLLKSYQFFKIELNHLTLLKLKKL